jgi:hypothetical protein
MSKELTKLKAKADKVFSQYVRIRDSGRDGFAHCITCDKRAHWKELQNGHFVSRACNLLRYDDENCNAQCSGCNLFKSGDLYQYAIKLDMKYGDGTAEKLHAQRRVSHKLTIGELEQIIKDAQEYINENT